VDSEKEKGLVARGGIAKRGDLLQYKGRHYVRNSSLWPLKKGQIAGGKKVRFGEGSRGALDSRDGFRVGEGKTLR